MQGPTTGPCPEQEKSNSHQSYFFNITPPIPGSSSWYLTFRLLNHKYGSIYFVIRSTSPIYLIFHGMEKRSSSNQETEAVLVCSYIKFILIRALPNHPTKSWRSIQVSLSFITDWTTGRSRCNPLQRHEILPLISCVQTGSGAHPASCLVGTGGLFPGVKSAAGGRDADHSFLSSDEVVNE
jgi:hypothetical protein